MLIPRASLERIRSGAITALYRCWSRPHARTGSTHKIPGGLIAIDAVRVVDPNRLSDADARPAGFPTASELRAELSRWEGDHVYRIDFHYAGPDPLIELRTNADLDDRAIAQILERLHRMDARSPNGAWTATVLTTIRDSPGTRARELAARLGRDVVELKRDVRKLKALGLTISLERGYELSPRGRVVAERVIAR